MSPGKDTLTLQSFRVIPKSNNQNRLAQNLDVTAFDLSNSELKDISGLNKNLRFNDPLHVCLPLRIVHIISCSQIFQYGVNLPIYV